jgi:hypothetical protein
MLLNFDIIVPLAFNSCIRDYLSQEIRFNLEKKYVYIITWCRYGIRYRY